MRGAAISHVHRRPPNALNRPQSVAFTKHDGQMPCVTGVAGCQRVLASGQDVIVDGTRGLVLAALHGGPRPASAFDERILATLVDDGLVELRADTAQLPA